MPGLGFLCVLHQEFDAPCPSQWSQYLCLVQIVDDALSGRTAEASAESNSFQLCVQVLFNITGDIYVDKKERGTAREVRKASHSKVEVACTPVVMIVFPVASIPAITTKCVADIGYGIDNRLGAVIDAVFPDDISDLD